jgi:hypothetical protein
MDVMTTKECRTCEQVKPLAQFYRNPVGFSGQRPDCKACFSEKRRAEYAAGAKGRNRDTVYEQLLKREYGMTLAEYNAKLRKQAHRCAVCRRPETVRVRGGGFRRLSVDHDHVTGEVRGLLCHRCNLLVWALEDNHTSLGAIATYIEEFRETFANQAEGVLA